MVVIACYSFPLKKMHENDFRVKGKAGATISCPYFFRRFDRVFNSSEIHHYVIFTSVKTVVIVWFLRLNVLFCFKFKNIKKLLKLSILKFPRQPEFGKFSIG